MASTIGGYSPVTASFARQQAQAKPVQQRFAATSTDATQGKPANTAQKNSFFGFGIGEAIVAIVGCCAIVPLAIAGAIAWSLPEVINPFSWGKWALGFGKKAAPPAPPAA